MENDELTPKEVRKIKYATLLAFIVIGIFVWGFITGLSSVVTGVIYYDVGLLIYGGFLMTPLSVVALYIIESWTKP